MTLSELRALFETIDGQSRTLYETTAQLRAFMNNIRSIIYDPNFSETIDVDQFVAIQTPIFTQMLTSIETAADAMNTDILH